MPLYDYQCRACEEVTEVRHGFKETYEEACGQCGGEMRRVFNPAPIVFKGSGFYVTDSRKSSSDASSSTKTEKSEKVEKSEPAAKSESTPAPAKNEAAA